MDCVKMDKTSLDSWISHLPRRAPARATPPLALPLCFSRRRPYPLLSPAGVPTLAPLLAARRIPRRPPRALGLAAHRVHQPRASPVVMPPPKKPSSFKRAGHGEAVGAQCRRKQARSRRRRAWSSSSSRRKVERRRAWLGANGASRTGARPRRRGGSSVWVLLPWNQLIHPIQPNPILIN